MRAYPFALIALALLAGSAGYVTHRVFGKAPALAMSPPAIGGAALATNAESFAAPANLMDWSFATPEGDQRRLSEWPGKVVVLNFWATWCPPCLREIPAFIALQQRYGESGVQFLGIALDQADAVGPFVAEKGINYPVLVGDDQVVRLMQALGNSIGGLPYTVVMRGGEVAHRHQGEWDAEEAEQTLLALLKRP